MAGHPAWYVKGALLGSANFLQGAAEKITALKDAALAFWGEYKEADQQRRQQIRDQLASLKWKPFGDVPALG